ncbi:MAG: pyridoxal-dependent decarboxylase [Actinomycetota bacterium]
MRAQLSGPPPEQGQGYPEVLARVVGDVLPYASRTDHPGHFAFVPSFTTWPAALAELTAAAANPYCGAWMESAAATQIELQVIDWFRSWLGLPAATAGVLVTGGSAANLTALLVAREAAGGPSSASVVYVSDQAHSSLARTARAMGLRPDQLRELPTDGGWRLQPSAVAAAVRADRGAGRVPFALCGEHRLDQHRRRRPAGGPGRRLRRRRTVAARRRGERRLCRAHPERPGGAGRHRPPR